MSDVARLGHLLARFWVGTAAGFGLGLVAFRGQMLDPRLPYSQVVSIGSLLAAVLALRRGGSAGVAVLVVTGFTVWQGWSIVAAVPARAIGHIVFTAVIGAGILVLAHVWDVLHRSGFRLGKFLLLGPALAGVYFAATPALSLGVAADADAVRDLLAYVFLGIVIGDGVGFGVELADLGLEGLARARGRDVRGRA